MFLTERRGVQLACVAGLALLIGWWSWSPRSLPHDGSLRVTFLDVGQGDATVIELPTGETLLIDAGAKYETLDMGRAVVSPYLWNRGITQLDHVIATHPQIDHIGGLASTLRHFPVAHYWDNGMSRQESFYQELQGVLQQRGVTTSAAEEGQIILASDACRLSVLNPPQGRPIQPPIRAESGAMLNNQSVVTRLDCGAQSFLFAADAEADTLARLATTTASADVRILKVPHHGARSSLDEAWIRHVAPELAVISVGVRNPYGHPADTVLQAYERTGIRLFRTDRDGAIWVTAHPSSASFAIHTTREIQLRPVRIGTMMLNDEYQNLMRLWRQWTNSYA